MMRVRIILQFIVAVALFASCMGRHKAPADNTSVSDIVADSISVAECYDSLVMVEARALIDTAYVSTDEYKSAVEDYKAVMDKWLEGKTEADQLLCQIDIAKATLESKGRHFATHTSEMRNPLNQKLMMTYSRKLRELQMRNITIKK